MPDWKFVALTYAWALERVESDKIEAWIADLRSPLPWQGLDSEAAEQFESESFFAMQGKGGG